MTSHLDFEWSRIGGCLNGLEGERIEKILSLLPSVTSILDVGCGDGRLTNRLIERVRNVVGVDISSEALRHVRCHTKQAGIEQLPFPNRSFELVIASEIIEHLGYEIYQRALNEISRVSSKYIFITVPNHENLRKGRVICPNCGCRFHSDWHVRSYSQENMVYLLPGYRLTHCEAIIKAQSYPDIVYTAVLLLGRIFGGEFPATTLCPQCGYNKGKIHPLKTQSSVKALSIVPKVSKYQWLTALYERVR